MEEIIQSGNNFDPQILDEISKDLKEYPEITEIFNELNKENFNEKRY